MAGSTFFCVCEERERGEESRLSFFFLFLFSEFVSPFSLSVLRPLRPNSHSCWPQTGPGASRPAVIRVRLGGEKTVSEQKEREKKNENRQSKGDDDGSESEIIVAHSFFFTSSQNSSRSTAQDWMFLSA